MAEETDAGLSGGDAATDHAADAAGHGAEAVGMPQLDIGTFPNQIFWLVITLVAIYLILTRVALPRIATVLAERQGTITNDIAAAEELKLKAREAEEAYNKALADARTEAHKIINAAKADIQADLDEAMKKADAEIAAKAAESEKAIAEIRENAIDSIREVAEATTGEIVAAMNFKAESGAVKSAIGDQIKRVAK